MRKRKEEKQKRCVHCAQRRATSGHTLIYYTDEGYSVKPE